MRENDDDFHIAGIENPPYVPGERYPYPLREVRFLCDQIWVRYANYGGRGRRTCIKCIETVDAGEMGGSWWYMNGRNHPIPRVCNSCMESVYDTWSSTNTIWSHTPPGMPGYFKYKVNDIVSIVHVWLEYDKSLIVIHGLSINRSIRPITDYPLLQNEMWSSRLPVLA